MVEKPEANLVVRALWFFFVGWWLSGLATLLATLLQLTIIGIPLAVWVINRMPQIVTLKSSRRLQVDTDQMGVVMVGYTDRAQRRWWVRAIYYVFVGWWAVSLWLFAAWFLAVTIILLPAAFWMYGATGKIQTLRR